MTGGWRFRFVCRVSSACVFASSSSSRLSLSIRSRAHITLPVRTFAFSHFPFSKLAFLFFCTLSASRVRRNGNPAAAAELTMDRGEVMAARSTRAAATGAASHAMVVVESERHDSDVCTVMRRVALVRRCSMAAGRIGTALWDYDRGIGQRWGAATEEIRLRPPHTTHIPIAQS